MPQLNFVNTGVRFAIAGGRKGLIAGYALISVVTFPPAHDWMIVLGAGALIAAFGLWEGVMLGISRENDTRAPFHLALTAGKHLVMIDVHADKRRSGTPGDGRALSSGRTRRCRLNTGESACFAACSGRAEHALGSEHKMLRICAGGIRFSLPPAVNPGVRA